MKWCKLLYSPFLLHEVQPNKILETMNLKQILYCASVLIDEFIFRLSPVATAGVQHTLALPSRRCK